MELFLSNFYCVAENVGTLFLLMTVGFVANKTKILNDGGAKCLSNLALLAATPCVIINSFIRAYDPAMMGRYLLTLLASLLIHAFLALASYFFVRDKEDSKQRVYRFSVLFSNAGYMALPLQLALLGEEGVFFGSAYVVGFNIVLWSYGVILMGGREKISPWKIVLNPGLLGVAVGMLLFVLSVPIPQVLHNAISQVASLNTPVPMFVIGYYFAQADIVGALKDAKGYYCMFLRLILLPVLCITLLWLFGFRSQEFIALSIAVATPSAAATTMFASMYDRDVALSARLVSFSTLISIVTMPVLVAVCMLVA